MEKRLKLRLLVLVTLIGIACFSVYLALQSSKQGVLTVAFLNIGQGDAIFIEGPTGNQMLIDGGPGRGVLREMAGMLPFYDRSINVVLATHPDADHIGGLPDVLKKYKTEAYLDSGVEADTGMYKEIESLVASRERSGKIKSIEVRQGMVVDLGGGATLEILFPVIDPEGMETNTASIVARLVYGESEFLLTGDSPTSIEDYLLNYLGPKYLDVDVLKAGHHGSRTSTSPEFVAATSPDYTVISLGRDNKYGHPHQEVLDTLTNFGTKILRTDLDGRIVFESDGVNLRLLK
jgi:competence protein ComEC